MFFSHLQSNLIVDGFFHSPNVLLVDAVCKIGHNLYQSALTTGGAAALPTKVEDTNDGGAVLGNDDAGAG